MSVLVEVVLVFIFVSELVVVVVVVLVCVAVESCNGGGGKVFGIEEDGVKRSRFFVTTVNDAGEGDGGTTRLCGDMTGEVEGDLHGKIFGDLGVARIGAGLFDETELVEVANTNSILCCSYFSICAS